MHGAVGIFKTLHVLFVVLLGSGIVMESMLGPLMPRAKSVQELRVLARLSRMAELFAILPALLLIPAFGYATGSKENIDFNQTWLAAAQGIFYIALLICIVVLTPASLRLNRKLRDVPDGPLTPELQREVKNPLLPPLGALVAIAFVVVVFLMVYKP